MKLFNRRSLVWLLLFLTLFTSISKNLYAADPRSEEYCIDESGEPFSPILFYQDLDGDGYGSDEVSESCEPPEGYVSIGGDCDDHNSSVFPGATEICDGLDNDCNDDIDDSLYRFNFFYPDLDGDGYGDGESDLVLACAAPPHHVTNFEDCDDTDPTIHGDLYYYDFDGDGKGSPNSYVAKCSDPTDSNSNDYDPDLVTNTDDCDDEDASVWGPSVMGYYDFDGDGYGNPSLKYYSCSFDETGYLVASGDDCQDLDDSIHPNAEEILDDGIDNNCNGKIDAEETELSESKEESGLIDDAETEAFGDRSLTELQAEDSSDQNTVDSDSSSTSSSSVENSSDETEDDPSSGEGSAIENSGASENQVSSSDGESVTSQSETQQATGGSSGGCTMNLTNSNSEGSIVFFIGVLFLMGLVNLRTRLTKESSFFSLNESVK